MYLMTKDKFVSMSRNYEIYKSIINSTRLVGWFDVD